jgi:hypothetical protein
MSEQPSSLKRTTKEWAKDYFLITPWNLLSFGITLASAQWLCRHVGIEGYASALGNLKLSGDMLLVALVAAFFIASGAGIFRIEQKDQTDKFWLSGLWIIFGAAGCVTFLGRALGIMAGLVHPATEVPGYLKWLFAREWIKWFIELGS